MTYFSADLAYVDLTFPAYVFTVLTNGDTFFKQLVGIPGVS